MPRLCGHARPPILTEVKIELRSRFASLGYGVVMSEESPSPEAHDGNWYVLIAGLPRSAAALTLAPGVSLRPLEQPLSVFDVACAGAVGFRGWAVLEPVAPGCCSEIESAKDAAILPGYDTLNRAWLASTLLVLRVSHSIYVLRAVPTHGTSLLVIKNGLPMYFSNNCGRTDQMRPFTGPSGICLGFKAIYSLFI